ncbi:MAG: GHKL domain-containing protein [Lachnospiraceae bacterium]|nr:GHKL domain-containing protein [Lachnospiraceae bacterium]
MITCILTTLEYVAFIYIILDVKLRKERMLSRGILIAFLLGAGGLFEMFADNGKNSSVEWLYFFIAWLNGCLLFEVQFRAFIKLFFMTYPCILMAEAPFYHFAGEFPKTDAAFQNLVAEISLLFLLLMIFFFRKGKKGFLSFSDPAWKFVIAILRIMALMMSYFMFVLEHIYLSRAKAAGDLVFIGGSIAINILIVAMIRYLNGIRTAQTEMDFMEKYHEQQKDYFMKLLSREQETKKFRHDIGNQLLQLQSYCMNGEYEKMQSFLEEVVHDFHMVRGKVYDVGNAIVNVILNYYFTDIQREVIVRVSGYIEEDIQISQRDLCILFSNLVKNAVEAVERCNWKEKEIILRLSQNEKGIAIYVENTFDSEELEKKAEGTIKDEKEQHGFGTRIIDGIVEKYHGDCIRMAEGEKFILEIYVPDKS